jgi:hypothetical protein
MYLVWDFSENGAAQRYTTRLNGLPVSMYKKHKTAIVGSPEPTFKLEVDFLNWDDIDLETTDPGTAELKAMLKISGWLDKHMVVKDCAEEVVNYYRERMVK